MGRFVIVNGKVVEKDEVNLSFLFWDRQPNISHKIWFGFGGIPLLTENIESLKHNIEILKLPCPDILDNHRELYRISKRMLNKNKFYRSGYLQLRFFWNDNQINSIITSESFDTFDFPISEKGIITNFSAIRKNSRNELGRYAVFNKSLWDISVAELHDTPFLNSILLNEKDVVCECISSNIFFIKGKKMVTPSLQTCCYEDILRNTILEISSEAGLKVAESSALRKEDIFEMDELFTAGEASGIEWILGVDKKRYIRNYASKIHQKLNEYLKEKVH